MLEKNLNLTEVMLAAYELYTDPTNKEKEAKVSEFIGQMVVLPFLPLRDKKAAIFKVLNLITDDADQSPEEVSSQMERMFTLEVINEYTNIQVESTFYDYFGEDFYDALEATGIMKAIEEVSEKDIRRLREMLNSTVNWRNIFDLINGFENIDMTHVDDLVTEVRAAREGLKEENLDLLKRLTAYNQPVVDDFSTMVGASIVNSLDKISEEQMVKWHEKHDMFIDLDSILGKQAYDNIQKNITEYFDTHAEYEKVSEKEIQDVYDYLKEKNQDGINKLDYAIAEENRASIEKGMTAQMIKLLSKKKALEKKYKKEEELIKLADTVMTMDAASIDEVSEILNKYKNDKEEKEDNVKA